MNLIVGGRGKLSLIYVVNNEFLSHSYFNSGNNKDLGLVIKVGPCNFSADVDVCKLVQQRTVSDWQYKYIVYSQLD